jgi:hypothetical protein
MRKAMRELSRNIVTDLLPAYYSGECSEETKQAVEEYFISDPDFAAKAKGAAQPTLPDVPVLQEVKNGANETLARTRRLLSWRSWLMAGGIFFTLSVFAFSFGEGKMSWHLLDSPVVSLANGIIGAICWTAYYLLRRKWNAVLK